jgi:hypothetical protein
MVHWWLLVHSDQFGVLRINHKLFEEKNQHIADEMKVSSAIPFKQYLLL